MWAAPCARTLFPAITDLLQSHLHAWAAASPLRSSLAAFLATDLLFLLGLAFLVVLFVERRRVSAAFLLRAAVAVALASLLGVWLNGALPDPRPYLSGHYPALAPTSADNGFPSDHTLAAALLSLLCLWLNRRAALCLGLGTLLLALARLATGAHHTLDVLGSLALAALGVGLAGLLPLPPRLSRALLAPRT